VDEAQRQEIADGQALEEIRNTEGFRVIERMLAKWKEEAVEDFASEQLKSRKELKGRLMVIGEFVPAVDLAIQHGREVEAQEKEAQLAMRGRAYEGGGTGDPT
jgi:hypothetical protein